LSYAVGLTRNAAYADHRHETQGVLNMLIRYANRAGGGKKALLDNWIFKLPVGNSPEAGGLV